MPASCRACGDKPPTATVAPGAWQCVPHRAPCCPLPKQPLAARAGSLALLPHHAVVRAHREFSRRLQQVDTRVSPNVRPRQETPPQCTLRHTAVKSSTLLLRLTSRPDSLSVSPPRLKHSAATGIAEYQSAHHPTRFGFCFINRNLVPKPCQMVGRRKPRGPEPTTRTRLPVEDEALQLPVFLNRQISQETVPPREYSPLYLMRAIARRFTRVITSPSHNGRQRIVLNQDLPRLSVVSRFR